MRKITLTMILVIAFLGALSACADDTGICDYCNEKAKLQPFKISDRLTADICEPCYEETTGIVDSYLNEIDKLLS